MKFIIYKEVGEGKFTGTSNRCTGFKILKPGSAWGLQTLGVNAALFSFTHPTYQLPPRDENTDLMNSVIAHQLQQMIDPYNNEQDTFEIYSEPLLNFIKTMEKVITTSIQVGKEKNLSDKELYTFLCNEVKFAAATRRE